MPAPELDMRKIRRHPDVITEAADLRPGMAVALCYLLEPTGRSPHRARPFRGFLGGLLMGRSAGAGDIPRHEVMKRDSTPASVGGIVVDHVATVNWVDATHPMHAHPFASFRVTRSTIGLSPTEELRNPAASVEEAAVRALELPPVRDVNAQAEVVDHFDLTKDFEDIGIVPEPYRLDDFVINLSR